jgi:FKBP-type peptidyl-prolyl cis-trans isomerase
VTQASKLTPIVSHDQGWDESVLGMSIGEIAKIHCSPDYAYGPGGFPAWGIMPNSELIFEIEVLSYS